MTDKPEPSELQRKFNNDCCMKLCGIHILCTQLSESLNPKDMENAQDVFIASTKLALEVIMRVGEEYCARKRKELETVVPTRKEYKGFTGEDICVAFTRTLEQVFGGAQAAMGFFKQMQQVSIVIDKVDGKEVTTTAVYGDIDIPAWEGASLTIAPGDKVAIIHAKKKYSELVNKLFDKVWENLTSKSIYLGKMVELSTDEWHNLSFRITEHNVNENIILNEREERMVQKLLIDRLGHKDAEPWIFTGTYGNGKSETALRAGIEATKKGMIFFYLKDGKKLQPLIKMVEQCYQPCLVLCEDMDALQGKQTKEIMDGSETKNSRLTVIFTTNHPEKLDPACRRPQRGALLEFRNPEANTRVKICRSIVGHRLDANDQELSKFWDDFPDTCGAVVAAAIKRSMAIATDDDGSPIPVTMEHLQLGLDLMRAQIDYMDEAPVVDGDPLSAVMSNLFKESMEQVADQLKEDLMQKLYEIEGSVDNNYNTLDGIRDFLSDELKYDTSEIRDHLGC